MTDKREKLQKEIIKLERSVAVQQEKVDGLLANDDFAKAEKEQAKLAEVSVQVDLRRQRVNQLVAEESDEKEQQRTAAITALTNEMVSLEETMKLNNEVSLALHGFWQAIANRQGKNAGDNPGVWSQSREDALLSDLAQLVETIKPALAAVNLKGAESLEARYRAAEISRNELRE